jgi:hypothetical protein
MPPYPSLLVERARVHPSRHFALREDALTMDLGEFEARCKALEAEERAALKLARERADEMCILCNVFLPSGGCDCGGD